MGKILFLFEGEEYEPEIFKTLLSSFAPDFKLDENGLVCQYCTHIYTLYSNLNSDTGLDLIGLLLENPEKYPEVYEAVKDYEYPEEAFEAIYLLFDYDGHVDMPRLEDGGHLDGDAALNEMLDWFDEPTENGKLFISYPMAEAIKHLVDIPDEKARLITTKCKGPHCENQACEGKTNRNVCPKVGQYFKGYVKNLNPHLSNTTSIEKSEWNNLFKCHLAVAELLCETSLQEVSQPEIFKRQLDEYISLNCPQVVVLSAFPFLFIDLIGLSELESRINT